MSGPKWKEALRSLDNRVENIRRKTDNLEDKDDELKSVQRAEVYRNANTLVEVAIKTRDKKESKKKSKSSKNQEVVKIEHNPKVRKVISTKINDGLRRDDETRELRRLRSRLSETKDALCKLRESEKLKSEEISGLRDIIGKLSSNNKAMVTLLKESTELEEELKAANDMNKELSDRYEREKSKNEQLAVKLVGLESEVERIRVILGSFTSSLSSEAAKILASKEGNDVSHLPATFDVSEDRSASTDSAIGESEATSKAKTHTNALDSDKKIDNIITSAKKLIVNQLDAKSTLESSSKDGNEAQLLGTEVGRKGKAIQDQDEIFESLDLSETVDSVRTAGSDSPRKRSEDLVVTLKARTVGAVNADLDAFLNKIQRDNKIIDLQNLSVPEVPSAKSFEEAAPSNIDRSGNTNENNDTLTESNFMAGLDQSISHTVNTEYDESLQ